MNFISASPQCPPHQHASLPSPPPKLFSLPETKRLLALALSTAFPNSKFRIFAHKHSLDIHWHDGPSLAQVNSISSPFQGCSLPCIAPLFFRPTHALYNGILSCFLVDHIFLARYFTRPFLRHAVKIVATECQLPPLSISSDSRILGGYRQIPFSFSPVTERIVFDPHAGDLYINLVRKVLASFSLASPQPVSLPSPIPSSGAHSCTL